MAQLQAVSNKLIKKPIKITDRIVALFILLSIIFFTFKGIPRLIPFPYQKKSLILNKPMAISSPPKIRKKRSGMLIDFII